MRELTWISQNLRDRSAQPRPFGSTSSITGLNYCYLYLVTIPRVGFLVMGCVLKRSSCLVSLGVLCFACGGCASPGPATPSLAAMPGRGKSYEAFQRDDQRCQSSAQQGIGYQSPGEAANQTTVRTAAVGTALGAIAGAAIGSVSGNMGTGAALGAGTGLVAGSAIGAGNGDAAGGSLQARYDTVYGRLLLSQFMFIRRPITGVQGIIFLMAGSRKRRSARRQNVRPPGRNRHRFPSARSAAPKSSAIHKNAGRLSHLYLQ